MRNFVRACCVLMLLASAVAGQTDQWKRYQYSDGNFSALFPLEPQDSVNKSDGEIKSHTLMAQQTGGVFMVVYSSMQSEQKVDDATYQVFKEAVFRELPKCDVVTEQPPSLPLTSYIGHWYRLNCALANGNIPIVGNLYWGKHYAYAVMAMFSAANTEPQATKNFVNSFALLEPAK